MLNLNTLLTAKDSRWLQLEVCREFQRSRCTRADSECKYAHPPPHVEIQNGRVIACYDSIKGRCTRENPPCKYFHPPQHLKEQLLTNGRNHLALKNALWQQMGLQPGQPGAGIPLATPLCTTGPAIHTPAAMVTGNKASTYLNHQPLLIDPSFMWTVASQPSYSPHIAPSDYHQVGQLKDHLRGIRFSSEDLQNAARQWPQEEDTGFHRRQATTSPYFGAMQATALQATSIPGLAAAAYAPYLPGTAAGASLIPFSMGPDGLATMGLIPSPHAPTPTSTPITSIPTPQKSPRPDPRTESYHQGSNGGGNTSPVPSHTPTPVSTTPTGLGAYKRVAGEKSGLPMYQGPVGYQGLVSLQQPFIPFTCELQTPVPYSPALWTLNKAALRPANPFLSSVHALLQAQQHQQQQQQQQQQNQQQNFLNAVAAMSAAAAAVSPPPVKKLKKA